MKTIIEMAKEAGFDVEPDEWHWLEKFAELVRADERDRAMRENAYVLAEREQCAKVVEAIEARCIAEDIDDPTLEHVAKAIRARGEDMTKAIRSRSNT